MTFHVLKGVFILKKNAADFTRGEIFHIAEAYASGTYKYTDFCEQYSCGKSTFYTILRNAVVKCIVPDYIVNAMENVAISNCFGSANTQHCSSSIIAKRISIAYENRRIRRAFFNLPKKESIELTVTYAISPLSKKDFCKKYFYARSFLDRTIRNSIIRGWIALETVETLRKKAYLYDDQQSVDETFDNLLNLRKKYEMSNKEQ